MKDDNTKWETLTEIAALLVLCVIAIVAMYELKVDGKEIALAIGSGIGGYLAKTAVNAKKTE